MTQPTNQPRATVPPGTPAPPIVPEPRSVLPAFIGLLVVLLAAGIAVATQLLRTVPPDPTPTPLPTPTTRPSTPETPTEPASPRLPATVGSFTAIGQPGLHAASYTSLKDYVMVSHRPGAAMTDAGLERPHAVGAWTCGTLPELRIPVCVREANAGLVLVRGSGEEASLSAFGDQLLSAWK